MLFSCPDLEGIDIYQLLNGGITPRPIAWISTRSKEGIDNLAPYSFFTVASCNPPVLQYTQIMPRNGLDKDTLTNLAETRECVINIVDTRLLEKMNKTSANISPEVSEFDFADVESALSHNVIPLSVKDSPIRYECTLRDIISVSDLPLGGKIILLDVISIYVSNNLMVNGEVDQNLLSTVGKLGGNYYSDSPNRLELARPK